ncbi:MAG TPA: amidohydrolase [Acidimicrobiales bacterium]|nr:amidohydrolase [Acidimicrobiales bacterium]
MCEACAPVALLPRPATTLGQDHPPSVSRGSRTRRSDPGRSVGVADLVIVGGPVLTMDPQQPRAESVAIRDGRIIAVGTVDEVTAHAGPGTEVLDLDGRALLPGLIDPHMHAAMVLMAEWVDVSPMTTPDTDAVLATLAATAPLSTGWVFAQQFDPTITAGHPILDRHLLDRIAPAHPLFVLESNLHVGYANSAALAAAGVDRDTPDPPTARFVRDAAGEPTGRVEETAALVMFMRHAPVLDAADLATRHRELLWHAASKGVTLLHDCGIGLARGTRDLDVLTDVLDADAPVRYRGMLVSNLYDAWMDAGLTPGFGDELFRVDGIKAWSDGSNQGGSGFQREPYLGTDDRGSLNYSAEQLADVVQRAHRDGWQIGVHANGDAAIDVTIEAYAQALSEHPRADHRHRIEHCSILHDDQITRMAELGLSPSFLIGHIRWWGRAFRDRLLGPERANRYDPCASALAGGLRISLHSDWNVTPLEPLRYVEDAVTRIMAEGGDVLNANERIGVEAALRAVTIDAAWQCRSEAETGSLEVGKFADLVLLEDDPTAVDPTTISQIAVSETRLAGEVRHTA